MSTFYFLRLFYDGGPPFEVLKVKAKTEEQAVEDFEAGPCTNSENWILISPSQFRRVKKEINKKHGK